MYSGTREVMYPYPVLPGLNPGGGKTFYVSNLTTASNSDDNEGTDPQYPLATIDAALALCTQRQHDYIFVQDSFDQDTWPVVLDIRHVHLIGLGVGGYKGTRALADGAGEACFQTSTSGGGFELAGFDMGSTGAADPCILVSGIVWSGHVHHCTFASTILAQDGIYGADGSNYPAYWTIEDNIFDTQLGRDGIRVYSGNRCRILNNEFCGYAGVGINIFAGSTNSGTIAGRRKFSIISVTMPQTGRDRVLGTLNQEEGASDFPGGDMHRTRYEQAYAKGLDPPRQTVGRGF